MLSSPDFDTIPDWLKVGLSVVTSAIVTLAGVLKIVREPILNQVNGLGGRVNSLEVSVGQHETALDRIDSDIRIATQERRFLGEQFAEMKGAMEKFTERGVQHHTLLAEKVGKIEVAIGRLEVLIDRGRTNGG